MRRLAAPAATLLAVALVGFAPQAGPVAAPPAKAAAEVRDDSAAEKLGFLLGAQAWTFRDRTACEAIATAHRLGLKYIELFPGQEFAPDHRDVKVGPDMGAANIDLLKKCLAENHVRAGSFGVVGMKNDEKSLRALFEFGRTLNLMNFSAEPDFDAFALVDRLAGEYSIHVAVHNHPKPSTYWNPDTVLAHVSALSKMVGSCSDTGHWTRCGLVPVDCLKKLEGRVIELHFKDLGEFGKPEAIDLPWGTGKSDARGILTELKRQGFHGLINVEYEDGSGETLEKNVAKCVAFFDATARELAAAK